MHREGGKIGYCLLCCLALFLGTSCRPNPTPRPRGYLRTELPLPIYDTLATPRPFQFEFSGNEMATSQHPYQFNIGYTATGATLYTSYMRAATSQQLQQLLRESQELTYRQGLKATRMGAQEYADSLNGVYATLFLLDGEGVASPMQCIITDSTSQLFRASLFFDECAVTDSLLPMIGYMEGELFHLIESFNWRDYGTLR